MRNFIHSPFQFPGVHFFEEDKIKERRALRGTEREKEIEREREVCMLGEEGRTKIYREEGR